MLTKNTTFGYLPFCTPMNGKPWFAGNVTIGYTASDARKAFEKVCGQEWEALKKEGWRIVRVKVEIACPPPQSLQGAGQEVER